MAAITYADGVRTGFTLTAVDTAARTATAAVDLGYLEEIADIAVGFGYVWVAPKYSRELLRVDPQRGEITGRIRLSRKWGTSCHDCPALAVGQDALLVATEGTVVRVDPVTGWSAPVPFDDSLGSPVTVATGAGAAWVLQKKGVSRLDPHAKTVTASIPLELRRPWEEIMTTPTAVWVADGVFRGCRQGTKEQGGTVYKIDPATNAVSASARLPCGAHLIARAHSDPVITYRRYGKKNTYEDWISTLDPSTAAVGRAIRVYSGSDPYRPPCTTGEGKIWIWDQDGLHEVVMTE